MLAELYPEDIQRRKTEACRPEPFWEWLGGNRPQVILGAMNEILKESYRGFLTWKRLLEEVHRDEAVKALLPYVLGTYFFFARTLVYLTLLDEEILYVLHAENHACQLNVKVPLNDPKYLLSETIL